jgi:hypothetical protein
MGVVHVNSRKVRLMITTINARTVSIMLACLVVPLGWYEAKDQLSMAATARPQQEVREPQARTGPSGQQTSLTRGNTPQKTPTKKDMKGKRPSKRQHPQVTGPSTGRKKTGKNRRPRAAVQSKPDLSYHGLLQHKRRYGSSLERRKGGVPNPQTSELLHEHFQELDKNGDGTIDPLERAMGRLDMDRDLSNRHWG